MRYLIFLWIFVSAPVLAQDANLNSVLWVQRSEEYAATTQGIYTQAGLMMDAALKDQSWSAIPGQKAKNLPPAIIMDVDETVLDNSPYAAWLIKSEKSWSIESWNKWIRASRAKAIPGVKEFVDGANIMGVKVFYVTNRDWEDSKGKPMESFTIKNLRKEGLLPQEGVKDEDAVLLKGEQANWTDEKISRRALVAKNYRVILLVGDSLGDFATHIKNLETRL